MHLSALGLLACAGRLWRGERQAIIVIEHNKPPTRWGWLASVILCTAVALAAGISTVDRGGLQVLLDIMRAGGGPWLLS